MQFCSLFDVKNSLDDGNFESFVRKIRMKLDELLGLETRLRILLSIGPNQSIVDSVSLLLLRNLEK
jgi:hypothetical protein